jgi:hypothetical protein
VNPTYYFDVLLLPDSRKKPRRRTVRVYTSHVTHVRESRRRPSVIFVYLDNGYVFRLQATIEQFHELRNGATFEEAPQ